MTLDGTGRDDLLPEIEVVYRSGFASFVRVAWALTGDMQLAVDAVQEGFAAAVSSRRHFRGEGTVESWLWSIVLNSARSARRSESKRRDVAERERLGQETEAVAGPERGELRRLLEGLSDRQREIVFLRYWADLDYRTIGQVLGVATGTVSATLSAAHETLRGRIEEVAH